MISVDFLNSASEFARKYRKGAIKSVVRNNHMNNIESYEKLQQRHIDAILVDFINFIGTEHCFDYGLHTCDLSNDKFKFK